MNELEGGEQLTEQTRESDDDNNRISSVDIALSSMMKSLGLFSHSCLLRHALPVASRLAALAGRRWSNAILAYRTYKPSGLKKRYDMV
jgi:hypothetical protein